ncbi:MAG: hypothetical protein B7X06_04545, partial [Verrucomicrobia bacterium 21-51-4]
MQSLSKLLKTIPTVATGGSLNIGVHALVSDSREVAPGSLFFAFPGIKSSGNDFMDEAVARGAVGVVSSEPLPKHCPVAYIQVDDARIALVEMAKVFYKDPLKAL